MQQKILPNEPLIGFNEWCTTFNVSSNYNKVAALHTRRKLPYLIFCDTNTFQRRTEENKNTLFILPHTQISFINGYK
jgi:hypothetical protein